MTLDEIRPFMRDASLTHWRYKNESFSLSYDCRIFAVKYGTAKLKTEYGEYVLERGASVLLLSGQPYRFRNFDESSPFGMITVNLDLVDTHTDLDRYIQVTNPDDFVPEKMLEQYDIPELSRPLVITDAPELAEIAFAIYDEYIAAREHYRIRLSAMVVDYIIRAVRHSEDSSPRGMLVGRIKNRVRDGYSERLTIEQIASELGYHPYYLSRIFAASEGVPLHRYISDFRLRAAMQLLTSTDRPIREIAQECGFSTPAHFTAAFKERYNLTPSEARRPII